MSVSNEDLSEFYVNSDSEGSDLIADLHEKQMQDSDKVCDRDEFDEFYVDSTNSESSDVVSGPKEIEMETENPSQLIGTTPIACHQETLSIIQKAKDTDSDELSDDEFYFDISNSDDPEVEQNKINDHIPSFYEPEIDSRIDMDNGLDKSLDTDSDEFGEFYMEQSDSESVDVDKVKNNNLIELNSSIKKLNISPDIYVAHENVILDTNTDSSSSSTSSNSDCIESNDICSAHEQNDNISFDIIPNVEIVKKEQRILFKTNQKIKQGNKDEQEKESPLIDINQEIEEKQNDDKFSLSDITLEKEKSLPFEITQKHIDESFFVSDKVNEKTTNISRLSFKQ